MCIELHSAKCLWLILFVGNKQKWVPMEIEHPKKDRSGRKGKGRGGDLSSRSHRRDDTRSDGGYKGRQTTTTTTTTTT